jgi:hypothetical protein
MINEPGTGLVIGSSATDAAGLALGKLFECCDNPDCQKRAGARPQALWGAAYNEAATGSKPGLVAFREQTGALHYVMQ